MCVCLCVRVCVCVCVRVRFPVKKSFRSLEVYVPSISLKYTTYQRLTYLYACVSIDKNFKSDYHSCLNTCLSACLSACLNAYDVRDDKGGGGLRQRMACIPVCLPVIFIVAYGIRGDEGGGGL